MTRPSKARIRQSFERAALTYDSAADIQRRICTQLADGLPDIAPTRLLDAGCGTGFAQADLQARFPDTHSVALDLSPAMLDRVSLPCCRIAGDLEHLPLADASLDLYWSSLAVQWCDLATALREAHRTLRPNGLVALASLGPATFHELRHAFADVDHYRHTLSFHSPDEIRKIAVNLAFATVNTKKSTKIAHYPDFKTLLRAVKAIGANQLGDGRRTSLMSRATFQRAEAAHEQLRTSAGLPLTYDVIYLYASK
ncbi:malonyl-ACP O-methyltransferase BioC [Dechloromonas sp.]|uniref:malonyl-ACP O-methyltransferase BioC n=1 Tax=Dechloromonas sp. TaxID=1917218 RepID=UPI00286E8551|nr:malonyl-ACP O-methyltransferase BioC [Dechloromonas sp.]